MCFLKKEFADLILKAKIFAGPFCLNIAVSSRDFWQFWIIAAFASEI